MIGALSCLEGNRFAVFATTGANPVVGLRGIHRSVAAVGNGFHSVIGWDRFFDMERDVEGIHSFLSFFL